MPLYVIVWVSLFTRNTLRVFPTVVPTLSVRNVDLPIPFGRNSVAVIRYCMGKFIYTEHPEGVPYEVVINLYLIL